MNSIPFKTSKEKEELIRSKIKAFIKKEYGNRTYAAKILSINQQTLIKKLRGVKGYTLSVYDVEFFYEIMNGEEKDYIKQRSISIIRALNFGLKNKSVDYFINLN